MSNSRHYFRFALTAFCLSVGLTFGASAQTTAVIVGSSLGDASQTLVGSGKLCFTPVDLNGNPMGIRGAGQLTTRPVCSPVLAGVISPASGTFQVTNTATAYPSFCYNVTLKDQASGLDLYAPKGPYSCVQMNSTWCSTISTVYTCNWDLYPPNSIPQAPISAPSLTAGTFSTGAPGSSVSCTVNVVGAAPSYALSCTIPKGDTGATGPPGTGGGSSLPSSGLVWATSTSTSRAATYSDVASLFGGGSCVGFLNGNGTCSTSSSGLSGTPGLPAFFNSSTTATSSDPTQGATYVAPITSVTVPSSNLVSWDTLLPGMTGMIVHGDSIVYCVGATGGTGTCPYLSTTFAGILAAHSGFTPVTSGGTYKNYGVSGDMTCDQANSVFNNDAPGTADTNYYILEAGLNDADVAGSGAYESVSDSCTMAALVHDAIPSNQKQTGATVTPATNWATVTSHAAVPSVYSTTSGAAQTWNFTTTNPNAPEVFIAYRCFDQGAGAAWSSATTYTAGQIVSYLNVSYIALIGSTNVTPTPGTTWASTAGSFSTTGTGATHYINTYTPVPMATFNGSTNSVCYADLGQFSGAPGAKTVTTTVTSSTGTYVEILEVMYGPESTTPPNVFFQGVSRNLADLQGNDTSEYNKLHETEAKYMQLLNFSNVYWVNIRSWWNNNAGDMGTGIGQHHPNSNGETLIARAYLAPMFSPTARPAGDKPLVRSVSTAQMNAGCALSATDGSVYFLSSVSGNCILPDEAHTKLPATLYLQNLSSTGIITLAGAAGNTGNAIGYTLARYAGVVIQTVYPGQWNVMGRGAAPDLSYHSCTIGVTMPYSLQTTDDCIYFNNSGTATPPTMTVGKTYFFKNKSSGNVTFPSGGADFGSNIPPNGGLIATAMNTGSLYAIARSNIGGYLNVTTLATTSPTLATLDEFIDDPNTGATTMTLPTTFVSGKIVPGFNRGTSTMVFSGASSGTATTATVIPGEYFIIVSGASGRWDVFALNDVKATTGSIGGSSLAAGACASGTATVSGATTSMSVKATPATYPGDGFNVFPYVSATGTVTVKVCAIVAGTPTASTYNVAVTP